MNISNQTLYAPADRLNREELNSQMQILGNNRLLTEVSDSISQLLLVLNQNRQIIFANRNFLNQLEIDDVNEIIGKRPGEAILCTNASKTKNGCGTSKNCQTCGALNSILESQENDISEKECRILNVNNDAFDWRVMSTRLTVNNEPLTIFTITDITNEKRRQILEKTFFHDILNSVGGINGLTGIMSEFTETEKIVKIAKIVQKASENLIDEIQSYKMLSAAEDGKIELNYQWEDSLEILNDILDLFSRHEITINKSITIQIKNPESFLIYTDKVLLRRIVGNMVKNAVEACIPKSTVTVSCLKTSQFTVFAVHNDGYISPEIQSQLFQRSFSTKGTGRGIGTYSMKLLGEKYLHSKVGFESTPENGTTFFIKLTGEKK